MKDNEKLRRISAHLYYEYSMFIAITEEMAKGYPPGTINNALLQSFALHVRNLIDFLYDDTYGSDDVYAGNYFETPRTWCELRTPIKSELSKARRRANKEVAHLTYSRLKVTPEEKKWHFLNLYHEMTEAFIPFLRNVDKALLSNEWDAMMVAIQDVSKIENTGATP